MCGKQARVQGKHMQSVHIHVAKGLSLITVPYLSFRQLISFQCAMEELGEMVMLLFPSIALLSKCIYQHRREGCKTSQEF